MTLELRQNYTSIQNCKIHETKKKETYQTYIRFYGDLTNRNYSVIKNINPSLDQD